MSQIFQTIKSYVYVHALLAELKKIKFNILIIIPTKYIPNKSSKSTKTNI